MRTTGRKRELDLGAAYEAVVAMYKRLVLTSAVEPARASLLPSLTCFDAHNALLVPAIGP